MTLQSVSRSPKRCIAKTRLSNFSSRHPTCGKALLLWAGFVVGTWTFNKCFVLVAKRETGDPAPKTLWGSWVPGSVCGERRAWRCSGGAQGGRKCGLNRGYAGEGEGLRFGSLLAPNSLVLSVTRQRGTTATCACACQAATTAYPSSLQRPAGAWVQPFSPCSQRRVFAPAASSFDSMILRHSADTTRPACVARRGQQRGLLALAAWRFRSALS